MRTLITAERLWTGTQAIDSPLLLIEDTRIVSIESRANAAAPQADKILDFPDCTIGPAFFDVHIHGAANHDVMEATPEALSVVGRFLASRGTANYLATTVTAPLDATFRALEGLGNLLNRAQNESSAEARPVGIHLEGPFLSHSRRGVHPPADLLEPSIELFDKFNAAAQGHIRLVTLAPELPGAAEFTRHVTKLGVRVSIGHSNATSDETAPVLAAGATSATHTFNAMRPLDHREPSILSTVLTHDELFAELICDGIHVAPEIVRLWWRMKGPNRGILVTDSMSATGMPNGTYKLGGFDVEVSNGRATANGVLAGSVLTQDRALENFFNFTGAPIDQVLGLLTRNPARMTGFESEIGHLAVGQLASLVIINSDGKKIANLQNGIQI